MIDAEKLRRTLARELRRGDMSCVYLGDMDADEVETLRAEVERLVKRPVSVEVTGNGFRTFDAGKAVAK